MYNSRHSGTTEAAELLHSQLAAESLVFKPVKVGSRETYTSYTRWTLHRWEVPNYFTFQRKEDESTTSPSDCLRGPVTGWTGLSCTACWPEVRLTFMNCKVSLDPFQYTVLYQQSRRGKEERRMKLSSPPRLPSQPQRIIPYLSHYLQPTGINSLKACGDESIIAINNTQLQCL